MDTQLSEAPVREPSTDGAGPTIRIAALPREQPSPAPEGAIRYIVELQDVSCHYGSFRAVRNVDIKVAKNAITALIGPSGCGKSTLLRTMNRMNDLIPSYRSEGRILLDGQDLFAKSVDPVAVRRRVGMVFQKPNPFPKSVYDNVAFGPRINGYKGNMDEPCSALDPRSTLQIEELMAELKRDYTIIIVTHNMQQAARASDATVFMTMGDDRAGFVVETGRTIDIFTNPRNQLTEDYVSGRFG